jgi:hypothetical protein
MPDPYAGLAEADGAFVGTLVEIDKGLAPITDSGQLVDFHFEVEAALKGEIGDDIVVKSANSGASCGIEMPVGQRAGFVLTLENGEWQGNLCATFDADALLLAAEGPPDPVEGSPPMIMAITQMGDAGVIALDRDGQIVGYGEGPPPTIVSACPDQETFIGLTPESSVKVWSFTDLAIVGEYRLDPDVSPWFYQLLCTGPGGNPYLAVTSLSGVEQASLIKYADGNAETLIEEAEWLVGTAQGPVVVASDGSVLAVDGDSGSLTEQSEPIGDVHGQLTTVVPSPDGSALAVGAMNWNVNPPQGRMFVIDLEGGTSTGIETSCDLYPVWLDEDTIAVWDCNTGVPTLYSRDLEALGPGDPDDTSLFGWTITDDSGATYFQGEFGLQVRAPGNETSTQFGPRMGHVTGALLVPESARSAWAGSDFLPTAVPEPVGPPDTVPPPGEVPIEEAPPGYDSPVWMFVVGAVMVTGVFWLLVRSPSESDGEEGPG